MFSKKKKEHEPSGYLGDLADYQEQVLCDFKKFIEEQGTHMGHKHPWYNDAYLLKFCRARKFDLDKVIEMWSNFMEYRREHNIDNLLVNFLREKEPKYTQ